MGEMEFRGSPRGPSGLDLSKFIHSQEVSETLATGTANKQAEIAALIERAKMQEEGATERTNINRASQEEIAAGNRASIEDVAAANRDLQRDIHTKDYITKEQIQQINDGQGTNYPAMDMPITAFVSLQANERAARSQEAIAARQAQSQDLAGQRFDIAEARRLAHEDRRAADVLAQQGLAQQRLDQQEAEKRRVEEKKSFAAEMAGSLNTDENPKTGSPTRFSPTKLLEEDPTAALALSEKAGRLGWPEKVGVKPLGPFREKGWFEQPSLYDVKKKEFEANKSQFQQNLKAPPSTGHGGASITKGVPKELASTDIPTPQGYAANPNALNLNSGAPQPTTQPTPAATQQVETPSTMWGFESKVGTQPNQPAPGPSAVSPPSSSPRPTVVRVAPDGRRIEYDAITKQPLRVVQ